MNKKWLRNKKWKLARLKYSELIRIIMIYFILSIIFLIYLL
jgi:hypothetical protein